MNRIMQQLNRLLSKSLGVFVVLLFVLLFGFGAQASFSSLVNYQGKLNDAVGNSVTDGSYNLRFKLCADSDCSSVLWTETYINADKVATNNGLFSVMLGQLTPLNNFDFNQSLYLEVAVGGTSTPAWETLLPRKILGAVPNAFNARRFDGLATSSFLRSDLFNTTANIGILSSTNVSAENISSTNTTSTNIFTSLLNALTSVIDNLTATWANISTLVFGNASGINLTATNLVVTSTANINSINASSTTAINSTSTNFYSPNAVITGGSIATTTIIGLGVSNFGSTNISQWLNDIGYVTSSMFTSNNIWTGTNSFATATASRLSVGTTSVASMVNVQGALGVSALNITSSTGASMFTIAGNGNVGIGTENPSYTLDVNGIIHTNSYIATTQIRNASASTKIDLTSSGYVDIASGNHLRILDSGRNLLVAGSVGIGTTTPNANLNIFGTTSTLLRVATSTNQNIFVINANGDTSLSGSLTVGNLNGPLQAINGLISATSSISSNYLASNVMLAGENVSLLSNDAGYITSTALSLYLTTAGAALTYQPLGNYLTTSTNLTISNFASPNISQWTNDAGYATSGSSGVNYWNDNGSIISPATSTRGLSINGVTTLFDTNVLGSLSTPNIIISSTTAGSVLFAGVDGLLSQKNNSFFWNNDYNRLTIGIGSLAAFTKISPTMSSNSTPAPYVASDSTNGVEAWKCFDNDAASRGFLSLAAFPHWVKIDMNAATAVSSYKVGSSWDDGARSIKTWTFEGSNNNSTWVVLDTQVNTPMFSQYETRTYTLGSIAYYRYYRINITANWGSAYTDVNELTLGTADTPNPLAKIHVNTAAATEIGQIIQGYFYQATDLSQWLNESGDILTSIDNAGHIKIGTTTDTALFAIQGTSTASTLSLLSITSSSGANLLTFNSSGYLSLGTTSASAMINLQAAIGVAALNIASSTGNSMLVVANSGNVGIGTSTPNAVLNVWGASNATTLMRVATSTNQNIFVIDASGSVNLAGNLTVSTLNGPLQAINGLISATSSISSNYLSSNVLLEGENISLLNNNAGYLTTTTNLSVSNFASQNISQWINDSGYVTSSASGINYFGLSGNYLYPTSTAYNLGLGTSTPREKLSIVGNAIISGTTTASCFTVDGINCLSSGMTLSNISAGSVLFADATNHITQNNPYFFWDNASARMAIGQGASTGFIRVSPIMSAIAVPAPYVVSSSKNIMNIVTEGWKCFDDLVSTRGFLSDLGFPYWVSIDMGSNTSVSTYQIGSHYDADPNRSIKNWTFEGSNNNSTWVVLDTQINAPIFTLQERRTYALNNIANYRYYRVNITANWGATYTDLTVITLGVAGTPAPVAKLHINTNINTEKGLIVQGAQSQTANLQEWQNNNGSILSAIDSSGHLLVGTTTATAQISIQGTSTAGTLSLLSITSSSGANLLSLNSGGYLSLGTTSASTMFNLQSAAGISALNISSSTGASMLFVSSNGNVGIGTTSPSSNLDVYGSIRSTKIGDSTKYGTITTDVNGNLLLAASGGSVYVNGANTSFIQQGGTSYLGNTITNYNSNTDLIVNPRTATSSLLLGTGGGFVGVGTTTPNAVLNIFTASSTNTLLRVATSTNQNIFVIDSAGTVNVGNNINVAARGYYKYNGSKIFYASTTLGNYFFGNSGNIDMTGDWNTGIGEGSFMHNTSGGQNLAFGVLALAQNTTGFGNVAIGTYAGIGSINGGNKESYIDDNMTFIGRSSSRDASVPTSTKLSNSTAIGFDAKVGGSDMLVLGNASTSVGIGTTTPAYTLDVVGSSNSVARFRNNTLDVSCTLTSGSGIIVCTSDKRLKKQVETISNPLDLVLALNPVSFYWNKDSNSIYKNFGFIAQEVEDVIPELVQTDASGMKSLAMANMIPFLAGAIQQQQLRISSLADSINASSSLSVTSADTSISSLVVNQSATFLGTITVRGEAGFESKVVFNDEVEFKDHLTVDSDTGGVVYLPAGATSVKVSFDRPYITVPLVIANLLSSGTPIFASYLIAERSTSSFTIVLANPVATELSFTWMALAYKEKEKLGQVAGVVEAGVAGCLDSNATNFNSQATYSDDSCAYPTSATPNIIPIVIDIPDPPSPPPKTTSTTPIEPAEPATPIEPQPPPDPPPKTETSEVPIEPSP